MLFYIILHVIWSTDFDCSYVDFLFFQRYNYILQDALYEKAKQEELLGPSPLDPYLVSRHFVISSKLRGVVHCCEVK